MVREGVTSVYASLMTHRMAVTVFWITVTVSTLLTVGFLWLGWNVIVKDPWLLAIMLIWINPVLRQLESAMEASRRVRLLGKNPLIGIYREGVLLRWTKKKFMDSDEWFDWDQVLSVETSVTLKVYTRVTFNLDHRPNDPESSFYGMGDSDGMLCLKYVLGEMSMEIRDVVDTFNHYYEHPENRDLLPSRTEELATSRFLTAQPAE